MININVFDLKLFALLMCPGSVFEKAHFLFDVMLTPTLLA